MRAVIQRVSRASVAVDGAIVGEIQKGYLALVCVEDGDEQVDAQYMIDKISGLRIFEDAEGKMNLSIQDVQGAALIVSQFTLMGDARKGRRPSFSRAARPDVAVPLLDRVIDGLKMLDIPVQTGQFQADMQVSLINDGPVTILLDSKKGF
ncbi:D-tyrosyl-tRNA(Tyr) deacylase [Eubacteriales bacterium OttesenSCG-928-N13]|nr:D-tyrosyl-tRNA(Tyr) deacylase [Eubacteriales bacterium OttesenSCG-928-N13]